MSLEKLISESVSKALKHLFDSEIDPTTVPVQETKKEFEGDRTVVVFPFLKLSRTSPEATAEAIGSFMVSEIDELANFNVVKGFLNLEVNDTYWIDFLNSARANQNYGSQEPNSKSEVMVEFSSPNTNKPLHLGHLRNIFLGDSVSSLLTAAGHTVHRVQIVNDRGIHICKSMVAWKKFGQGESPENSDLKGDKLVGKYYVKFDQVYKAEVADLMSKGTSKEEAEKQAPILIEARETLKKWEEKDPDTYELWKTMNHWVYNGFEKSYNSMNVSFDKLYYESDTYLKGKEEVEKGLESGAFYRKDDGSVWCDLTDRGLDQKLVLRADGTAVYMTQDIGTAILRFQEHPELAYQIYTVGNEQEYHFKVLFLILEKLGFKQASQNYHLSYGMVELPEGKMKSREGTVVDADDIMAEMITTAENIAKEQGKLEDLTQDEKTQTYQKIGLGALKYFLLKVDPRKGMMFNPEESVDFQGNTGPFIQYSCVRAKSVLKKNDSELGEVASSIKLNSHEKNVLKRLYDYPSVISEAAKSYSPALLANYIYDLVKDYNSFYQNVNILKEENLDLVNLRLNFSHLTAQVIADGMSILGVEMPEKM